MSRLSIAFATLTLAAACGRMGFDARYTPEANATPLARSGSSFRLDASAPITVTLDAVDPDGDALTVILLRAPEHGSVAVDADATPPRLTYAPEPGWVGVDSIAYVVSDGLATSDVATVDLAVPSPRTYPAPGTGSDLASCGVLAQPGTYRLTADLSAAGDCLTLAADDVIVLGGGHHIASGGRGVSAANVARAQIVDLSITSASTAVDLAGCTACLVRGVAALADGAVGVPGVQLAAGSDDVDVVDVTIDGYGVGVLVAASQRARVAGLRATDVAGPGAHFYDEAGDAWLVDVEVSGSARGISCDRCQRLRVVGGHLADVGTGAAFVFAGDGHHLADVTIERAAIGLEFEHWGGCDDVRIDHGAMRDLSDAALVFAPGGAHQGIVLRGVGGGPAVIRNDSGSTYRLEGYLAGRVDATDAAAMPSLLRWRDATGVAGDLPVEADGILPLQRLPIVEATAAGVAAFAPYSLEDAAGLAVAVDLALDGRVVTVTP